MPPESILVSVNKRIAVEPFPSFGIETKNKNAFTTVVQKTDLIPLRVVFASDTLLEVRPGDVVYVRGETQQHQWSKEVFELGGKKFIFIPEDVIVLLNRPTP